MKIDINKAIGLDDIDRVADVVRDGRITAGMTQAGLAEAAGVGRNTLGKLEGRSLEDISFGKVAKLVAALGYRLVVVPTVTPGRRKPGARSRGAWLDPQPFVPVLPGPDGWVAAGSLGKWMETAALKYAAGAARAGLRMKPDGLGHVVEIAGQGQVARIMPVLVGARRRLKVVIPGFGFSFRVCQAEGICVDQLLPVTSPYVNRVIVPDMRRARQLLTSVFTEAAGGAVVGWVRATVALEPVRDAPAPEPMVTSGEMAEAG